MEEPEQEREDGTESPKGRGAAGAAPQRPAYRPPPPRGPRRRRARRFTGGLRGLPLLPQPPARPRPPPPAAAAATAAPCPPRPPRLSLRAAGDQRPRRTRLPTANRRRGRATSHTAELEEDASPTSRDARAPTSLRAGHAPSDVSGGGARGGRTQRARAGAAAAPPTSKSAGSLARVQEVGEEPHDPPRSSLRWPAPSSRAWRVGARALGSCSLSSRTLLSLSPTPPRIPVLMERSIISPLTARMTSFGMIIFSSPLLTTVRETDGLEGRWEEKL